MEDELKLDDDANGDRVREKSPYVTMQNQRKCMFTMTKTGNLIAV